MTLRLIGGIQLPNNRDVIDMTNIDISITLLKQYSLLSLVNTHINATKHRKNEMVKNVDQCLMIFPYGILTAYSWIHQCILSK